jgi:peptide/nickel transport system substrate-binding protein
MATPKMGGHLRLGLAGGATTDTLVPGTHNDDVMRHIVWAIRNNLTEIDNSGQLVGELAESWEVAPGAKHWVFLLRKGVTFHSGKTLDAEDVVASLNLHREPDTKSAAKPLLEQVEELKGDGKDKVIVTLKAGNADFAAILTDYNLYILPAKDGKADIAGKDGTGPYTLESFDPGVSAALKRNPNSWKQGRGHFDSVEITMIADPVARTNALLTRSVDAINRVELKTAGRLQATAGVKLEEATGTQHYTLPMLTDVDPFKDNNVRMALKHAIDRQALVDKILFGHGRVANDHPIAPANRYFAADIPQRDYDPERAKHYLKQAGLSSLKVQLSAAEAAFGGAVDAAVLYRDAAAKAGIDIEVVREPNDGYWDKVWLKKPWCMSYWTGRPTEDWMFSQAYSAEADWNETHWKHDRFNELLVQARAEIDEGKRGAMYREMQLIVRDEGGAVIPMYANYVWATADNLVHDDKVAANWEMDGNRAIERWWFA